MWVCLVPVPPPPVPVCDDTGGRKEFGGELEGELRFYTFLFLAAEFLVSYGVFSIYRGFSITSEQSRLFIYTIWSRKPHPSQRGETLTTD